MDPTEMVNERVDVAVVYRKDGDICTQACPKKMIYRGREVKFVKLAMRHPTVQGLRMIHVFDMSDGVNDYRLGFDAERLVWTLVSMISGEYHER